MRYLADACALIVYWLEQDAVRTMPRAAAIMGGGDVHVSPVTVWEVTRKVTAGKLPSIWGNSSSFSHMLLAEGYQVQPLAWEDVEAANRLPLHHRDPMDRMLIATALRADMTIISNDAVFASYGVRTVW